MEPCLRLIASPRAGIEPGTVRSVGQRLTYLATGILPKSRSFYAPVTIVRGHLDLPLSVRLSVGPYVRHTLRYRVCLIDSSYSFRWIFLKPCVLVIDIMKMCM